MSTSTSRGEITNEPDIHSNFWVLSNEDILNIQIYYQQLKAVFPTEFWTADWEFDDVKKYFSELDIERLDRYLRVLDISLTQKSEDDQQVLSDLITLLKTARQRMKGNDVEKITQQTSKAVSDIWV